MELGTANRPRDATGGPSERLEQALDLMDAGFAVQRQKLRQRYRDASAEELSRLMQRWLRYEDV